MTWEVNAWMVIWNRLFVRSMKVAKKDFCWISAFERYGTWMILSQVFYFGHMWSWSCFYTFEIHFWHVIKKILFKNASMHFLSSQSYLNCFALATRTNKKIQSVIVEFFVQYHKDVSWANSLFVCNSCQNQVIVFYVDYCWKVFSWAALSIMVSEYRNMNVWKWSI
jgi:hypothetical protein